MLGHSPLLGAGKFSVVRRLRPLRAPRVVACASGPRPRPRPLRSLRRWPVSCHLALPVRARVVPWRATQPRGLQQLPARCSRGRRLRPSSSPRRVASVARRPPPARGRALRPLVRRGPLWPPAAAAPPAPQTARALLLAAACAARRRPASPACGRHAVCVFCFWGLGYNLGIGYCYCLIAGVGED